MPSIAKSPTIVALATPTGIGGVAVIRVSGPNALNIASKISGKSRHSFKPRFALYCGLLTEDHVEIDSGLITYFKAPNSYTGEDIIEISCHGGYIIPKQIIKSCLSAGCAPAAPGEFTYRAFINGKMDLSQAEAVADTISAKTELSQAISYKYLSGSFSLIINNMKSLLFQLISIIEAELDFSDEEITSTPIKVKLKLIEKIIKNGSALIKSYSTGRLLKEGAVITIAGEPNVGKSSLLNAIISEERVIVADVPGTTRDAVEVFYQIKGLPVRFVDTAGIRKSTDSIEIKGVEISRSFINKSDLVLWVFDTDFSFKEIQKFVFNPLFKSPFIPILNKIDLPHNRKEYPELFTKQGIQLLKISALKGTGIKDLVNLIHDVLMADASITGSELLLMNSRHRDAIEKSLFALQDARALMNNRVEDELIASRLRDGLFELDKILGVTTADDIINNIFSTFCVGK